MQEEGCSNFVESDSSIGTSFNLGGGISEGNNNVQVQGISNEESDSRNIVLQNSHQNNEACHNASFCANTFFHGSFIGESDNFGNFNLDSNNNMGLQNISNIDGENGNSLTQSSNQENKNCGKSAGCFNLATQSSSIGEILNVGPSSIGGNNNFFRATVSSNDSYNSNRVEQSMTEQNHNCEESFCFNSLNSFAGVTPPNLNRVANTGSNNNISNAFINTDSNNNNKFQQQATQINTNCADSNSCTNSGTEVENVGLDTSASIITSDSNITISNSTTNTDTNNNNVISQTMDQNNLCRDWSDCHNEGNLIANINGQNDQNMDQSLTQKNLCLEGSTCNNDGRVVGISGSNTQSNICLKNSACSNNEHITTASACLILVAPTQELILRL